MKHGFGIIGAGGIADVHARAIKAINGTGPSGVYDTDRAKCVSFGQKYDCKAFESPDDLCRDPDIDIVCICTPWVIISNQRSWQQGKGNTVLLRSPLK